MLKFRKKHGPEWFIRRDLKAFLEARGWLVEITHGNKFQQGFPDLFIAHPKYATRWVDTKNPASYSLTQAQRDKWPIWEAHGVGIWILTGGDQENYDKLFSPPNWRDYWKKSYGEMPDVDEVLDLIELDAHEAHYENSPLVVHGRKLRDGIRHDRERVNPAHWSRRFRDRMRRLAGTIMPP